MLLRSLGVNFTGICLAFVVAATFTLIRLIANRYASAVLIYSTSLTSVNFRRIPRPTRRRIYVSVLLFLGFGVVEAGLVAALAVPLLHFSVGQLLCYELAFLAAVVLAVWTAWSGNVDRFRYWDRHRMTSLGSPSAGDRRSISSRLATKFTLDAFNVLLWSLAAASIFNAMSTGYAPVFAKEEPTGFELLVVLTGFVLNCALAAALLGPVVRWGNRRHPEFAALSAIYEALHEFRWHTSDPLGKQRLATVKAGTCIRTFAERLEARLPYPLTSSPAALLKSLAFSLQEFAEQRTSLVSQIPPDVINRLFWSAVLIVGHPTDEFCDRLALHIDAFDEDGKPRIARSRTPIGRLRGLLSNTFRSADSSITALLRLAQISAMALLVWLWWHGDLNLVELAKEMFQ